MDQTKQARFRPVYSIRTELMDNTNKKVLGKFKGEMNTLIMTEFIALNPKVYSINHRTQRVQRVGNQEQEDAERCIKSGCQEEDQARRLCECH